LEYFYYNHLSLQARYVTALIKGNFTLPTQTEMMKAWQRHADLLRSNGRPLSHIHLLAEKEVSYVNILFNHFSTLL
jgi:hypothetical protein